MNLSLDFFDLLPDVSITHIQERQSFTFASPNPSHMVSIHNRAGEYVGWAEYARSRTQSRTYLLHLEIEPEYRRKRYGTAVVALLAFRFGGPITPLTVLHWTSPFWTYLRSLCSAGVNIAGEHRADG